MIVTLLQPSSQQIHVIVYLALMQLDMRIDQSESLMKVARL
jgi:hypothetical protein